MKIIKVELSKSGLTELKYKIQKLNEDLNKAEENAIADMTDLCEDLIKKGYASSPYTDGNDDASFFKQKKDNKTKVGVKGSQVLYREFGTGTEGLNSPHPMKGNYKLKGYNTGEKIRVNSKNGELYWVYKDKNGKPIYTQGIPAGKEVFNASVILKGKKISILKKRASDVLSKL